MMVIIVMVMVTVMVVMLCDGRHGGDGVMQVRSKDIMQKKFWYKYNAKRKLH